MRIAFECLHCHARLETEASSAGADVNCPSCGGTIKVPSADLGPGATLGGYRVESKLGVGGMGEVYLAVQLSMEREVALKVLPSHMSMRKDLSARFLNEVKLLARLEHPNIVTAHDAGSDGGMLYFAMAYVKGESAEDHIHGKGVFGEREALVIARKLAGALAYAWNAHQLLHRDIKPSNILLDESGEPRLADFGLAKSLSSHQGMTMSNTMLGTPNYMSPEQVEGGAAVDVRADMYSLGATLYHMLTGELPFTGSSVMDVLRRQLTESLPDPRAFNPQLSEGAVDLLAIMLSKERESRHETWESLLADIDSVLAGGVPLRAVPATGASTLIRLSGKTAIEELRKAMPSKAPGARPRAVPRVVVHAPTPLQGQAVSGRRKPTLFIAAGVIVLAAAGAILAIVLRSGREQAPALVPLPAPDKTSLAQASVSNAADAPAAPGPADSDAKQAYYEAVEYKDRHPDDILGILSRFEAVRENAAGTEYEKKAADQVRIAEDQRKQALQVAWNLLRSKAETLVAQGRHDEAMSQLADYAGPYAEGMAALRETLASGIRAQKAEKAKAIADAAAKRREAEAQAKREKETEAARVKVAAALSSAADSFLKAAYPEAVSGIQAALKDPALAPARPELERALAEVQALAEEPRRILASFESQKGSPAEIEFANGRRETLKIVDVIGERVSGMRQVAGGQVGREFGPNDLSAGERAKRAGAPTLVAEGALAARAGNFAAADALLKQADSAFAQAISARIAEYQSGLLERNAGRALETLLANAGFPGVVKDPEKTAEGIVGRTYSRIARQTLSRTARDYREKYGQSAIARSNDIVIMALEGLAEQGKAGPAVSARPAVPALPTAPVVGQVAVKQPERGGKSSEPEQERDVKAEKAEKDAAQALADILKMAGFGPDWDKPDELLPKIAAKSFSTEEAAGLAAAIEAMEREFGTTGFAGEHWRILDFLLQAGPEARRPFVRSTEENRKRSEADARRDNAKDEIVVDVKPYYKGGYSLGLAVAGGPSFPKGKYANTKSLKWLEVTQIALRVPLADWSVIRAWPLTHMEADFIAFDANDIAGLPITALQIYDCEIRNADKLATLTNVTWLRLSGSAAYPPDDLKFTQGMQLSELMIQGSFSDLSPLKGQPIKIFTARNADIKDLTPLAGAPLEHFNLTDCAKVSDISAFAGKSFRYVDISGTDVVDLAPLASMTIGYLWLGHPKKTLDISALEGKQLKTLRIYGRITSFAPLANSGCQTLGLIWPD